MAIKGGRCCANCEYFYYGACHNKGNLNCLGEPIKSTEELREMSIISNGYCTWHRHEDTEYTECKYCRYLKIIGDWDCSKNYCKKEDMETYLVNAHNDCEEFKRKLFYRRNK